MNNKKINKALQLYYATMAYFIYNEMEIRRIVAGYDTTPEGAKRTVKILEALRPGLKFRAEDFIFDSNELADEALDLHNKFKQYLLLADETGIPKEALICFCQSIYNSKLSIIKQMWHFYPIYFDSKYCYNAGIISKKDFKNILTKYSISTNLVYYLYFRRSIRKIENLLNKSIKESPKRLEIVNNQLINK